MEDVGAIATDPLGSRIVFERMPPYASRTDFGVSEGRFSAELYVYERGRSERAKDLLNLAGAAGEWLGPFSPNGSHLFIYWRYEHGTRAGIYDFERRRLVPLPHVPYYDFAPTRPVWLSEHEIAIASLPPGTAPVRPAYRKDAARKLAREWERAWQGKEATVSVLSSSSHQSANSPREGRLVSYDARSERTREISQGLFVGLTLSPDGRHLAAAQRSRLRSASMELPVSPGQGPYSFNIVVFDLKDRGRPPLRACDTCEAVHTSIEWNATGDRLTFFARPLGKPWSEGSFFLFDLRSGRLQGIPHLGLDLVSQRERGGQPIPEQAVPFGQGIAVAARRQAVQDAPPMFSDRPYRAVDRGRIDWYLVTPDGRSRNLTQSLDNVSPLLIGAHGEALFMAADGDAWRVEPSADPKNLTLGIKDALVFPRPRDADGYGQRALRVPSALLEARDGQLVARLDLLRETVQRFSTPAGTRQIFQIPGDASGLVLERQISGATVLSVLADDGREVPFWTFNSHLARVQSARQVQIHYKLRNGEDARSCALLPPNWTPGNARPVIVHVYPGPNPRCWVRYTQGTIDPYEPELFASKGYVVLFPFAPESHLRNADGPLGNWAEMVLPAVDALAAAGYGDRDRLGAFGWSYGGMSVLALLTQTDRFRAAVAGNSASNFTSHYGTLGLVRRLLPDDLFAAGQSFSYESRASFLWLGSAPWIEPDRYIRASPFFAVERIQTPLMLVHSDLDWNYPMEQFDEVFTALFHLNRETQYVRYWGEGHGVASPANIRDMWQRTDEWFRTHLR